MLASPWCADPPLLAGPPPGKYQHRVVMANQFSVRVKRGDKVFTQVTPTQFKALGAGTRQAATQPTAVSSSPTPHPAVGEGVCLRFPPTWPTHLTDLFLHPDQVLSMEDGSASGSMRGWKWSMPAKTGTYHAVYPRAWTVYEVRGSLIQD